MAPTDRLILANDRLKGGDRKEEPRGWQHEDSRPSPSTKCVYPVRPSSVTNTSRRAARILQNMKSCGLLASRWHESPSPTAASPPGGDAGSAGGAAGGACRESFKTPRVSVVVLRTTTLTRKSVTCHAKKSVTCHADMSRVA